MATRAGGMASTTLLLPLRLRTPTTTTTFRRVSLKPPHSSHLHSLSPQLLPPPKHLQFSCRSSSSPSPYPHHNPNFKHNIPSPFLSLSLSPHANPPPSTPPSSPDPLGNSHENSRTLDGGSGGLLSKGGAIWRVVLLGWLGAEHRQLNKYAQLYESKGISPVSFVVPVKEALSFDLARGVQDRIDLVVKDIVAWCSEENSDGRRRYLIFHTFSNTGWLAYGHILDSLQTRPDILDKIRGCVIDSGPAAEINPKVWAAGFTAALLKKRSSLTYPSVESIEASKLNGRMDSLSLKDTRPSFLEIIVFYILEIFFSIALRLPDVNRRLTKIISVLSDKQPFCPQLYLYSSADKVIPADSVINFIKKQKEMGISVSSYDFVTSPHVDHLRRYPEIYSAKIDEFLKECCKALV